MPKIEKISVSVTAEQLVAMKAAVDSGEYATTSEIVRHALRDWQLRQRLRHEDIERFRALVEEGINSGPAVPLDFDELEREFEAILDEIKRDEAA